MNHLRNIILAGTASAALLLAGCDKINGLINKTTDKSTQTDSAYQKATNIINNPVQYATQSTSNDLEKISLDYYFLQGDELDGLKVADLSASRGFFAGDQSQNYSSLNGKLLPASELDKLKKKWVENYNLDGGALINAGQVVYNLSNDQNFELDQSIFEFTTDSENKNFLNIAANSKYPVATLFYQKGKVSSIIQFSFGSGEVDNGKRMTLAKSLMEYSKRIGGEVSLSGSISQSESLYDSLGIFYDQSSLALSKSLEYQIGLMQKGIGPNEIGKFVETEFINPLVVEFDKYKRGEVQRDELKAYLHQINFDVAKKFIYPFFPRFSNAAGYYISQDSGALNRPMSNDTLDRLIDSVKSQ